MMNSFNKFKEGCKSRVIMRDGSEMCVKHGIPCSDSICQKYTPPIISYGNNIGNNINLVKLDDSIKVGKNSKITHKQMEAYGLRKTGMKYKNIAKKMNISIKQAHKHVSNYLRNTGVIEIGKNNKVGVKSHNSKGKKIRLHNDNIKIQIVNDLKECKGRLIHWHKNCDYKIYTKNNIELRFFEKTTNIKFKKDIIAETEDDAEKLANERIKSFLYDTYGLNQYVLLKRHYGILGTQLAKEVRKKGLEIIIYDDLKPMVRQRIDFSHDVPEIDSESVEYGKTDSEKTSHYLGCIIKKPHYDPYQTKIRIDAMYNVLHEYAEQLKLHLDVEIETKNNIKLSNEVQKETLKTQRETLKTLKAIQENLKK